MRFSNLELYFNIWNKDFLKFIIYESLYISFLNIKLLNLYLKILSTFFYLYFILKINSFFLSENKLKKYFLIFITLL